MQKTVLLLSLALFISCAHKKGSLSKSPLSPDRDPYQWLEEVEGQKALDWATSENSFTVSRLQLDPRFKKSRDEILAIYDDPEKIPYGRIRGKYVYNFWRDKNHRQGLYRRTTLKEYRKKKTKWENLIDFDELSKSEGKTWVYKGITCLQPDYVHCLVRMSDGGSDAAVSREYNTKAKKFLTKKAFIIPESKHRVRWIDKNSLIIGYDYGKDSMTDSGYPRTVRVWNRGTPINSARLIYEGKKSDVSVGAWRPRDLQYKLTFFYRSLDFHSAKYTLQFDGDKKRIPIDIPITANIYGIYYDHLLVRNARPWSPDTFKGITKRIPAGSITAIKLSAFRSGEYTNSMEVIWSPKSNNTLNNLHITSSGILLDIIEDVKGKAEKLTYDGFKWKAEELSFPQNGRLSFFNSYYDRDTLFYTYEGFLKPESLYLYNLKNSTQELLKSKKAYFDSSKYMVEQLKAKSNDGTMVPYFIVRAKDLKYNGENPAYLYGYGGFEISTKPFYSSVVGSQWLEKGGVYIVANIRGGGEYGPSWHRSALKENRQRSFDDFIAVAEDLIERDITNPKKLGISGGSNGGLLVGVAFTQRPDLFNAVSCRVPLLDMLRFNKLLAGASWMGEYGNPDNPEDKKYLLRYSPYHNVHRDLAYPEVYFFTSTKDDRVHPGHARKMVARMRDQGHQVLYYENIQGGHGGSANLKQRAELEAMSYVYFWQKLMD